MKVFSTVNELAEYSKLNPKTIYRRLWANETTENGSDPDHFLFQTLGKHGPYEERPLTPKAVDCLVKSLATKALIRKRIHPHVIRHTFATTLLDNGNDLKTVQALMGHSHIRTTERYLHSTDDRKVEAINSLQFGI